MRGESKKKRRIVLMPLLNSKLKDRIRGGNHRGRPSKNPGHARLEANGHKL